MDLTSWLVILAIALAAIVFFCSRGGHRRSLTDRARHAHGMRLLVQAAIALWAALLMLDRSFLSPGGAPFGHALNPRTSLAAALALVALACICSYRASRLLKARRIFSAC